MPARPLLILLLDAVGVSWAAPLIRLALDEGAPALAIAAHFAFWVAALECTSINYVLATVPAGVVAVAILGEPAISVATAGFLVDEVPTLLELVGGAVVLAGVYVALRGTGGASLATVPGPEPTSEPAATP